MIVTSKFELGQRVYVVAEEAPCVGLLTGPLTVTDIVIEARRRTNAKDDSTTIVYTLSHWANEVYEEDENMYSSLEAAVADMKKRFPMQAADKTTKKKAK